MLSNRQIYLNMSTTSAQKNMIGKSMIFHRETFKVSVWFYLPYQYQNHAIVISIKKEK